MSTSDSQKPFSPNLSADWRKNRWIGALLVLAVIVPLLTAILVHSHLTKAAYPDQHV